MTCYRYLSHRARRHTGDFAPHNGETVNACLFLAPEADGCEITTIEGVDHPIEERFAEAGAFQCGFCAPGAVMSACRMLKGRDAVTQEEALEGMAGHLCRCTGYTRILKTLRGEQDHFAGDPDYVIGQPLCAAISATVAGRARFTADMTFPACSTARW